MKPHWTAADLADKGYREVFGKYGKVSGVDNAKTRMRGGVEGHAGDAMRKHDSAGMRTTVKNRQQPESSPASSSHYKSKWEAAYAGKLELEQRAALPTFSFFWHPHDTVAHLRRLSVAIVLIVPQSH